jgi:hypothetical protein
MRQIKAQLAANGNPLAKAATPSWRILETPNILKINKLGQPVSTRRLRYQNLL